MATARRALVISNGIFEDGNLQKLQAPGADGKAIAGILADPAVGGFEVQLAVDEKGNTLRRELGRFFEAAAPDDVLLVYLITHGLKDSSGRLHFAATDTDVGLLTATSIAAAFLDELIDETRARTVVLILDCAYSGAFPPGRNRVVLTASGAAEYAFEAPATGERPTSVFSGAFLRGISTGEADLNQDGEIDAQELFEYIRDALREAGQPQTPTWSSSAVGRVVIAQHRHGKEPEPGIVDMASDGTTPVTSEPEAGVIAPEAVASSDYWTTHDELDYAPFADAISEFIQHGDTAPPLTIGVKAPWGAGKTSLMHMIQNRLDPPAAGDAHRAIQLTDRSWQRLAGHRRHDGSKPVTNRVLLERLDARAQPRAGADADEPLRAVPPEVDGWRPTVWFNPWMYQSGEQIWAGLAHEVIAQITGRMRPADREAFWLELNLRRVDADALRRRVHQALFQRLLPVLAALGVAVLIAVVAYLCRSVSTVLSEVSKGLLAAGTAGTVITAAVRTVGFGRERVAGSLSALVRPPDLAKVVRTTVQDETKGAFAEVVPDPGYAGRLGNLYLTHTDIRRVLDLVATRERPVVVFVDDLDRCSPAAVAQVIEAINLFLAGQFPNCVFVLAMDPDMVAAHIEVAYESLVKNLAGDGDGAETRSLGWRFLDKIVQLPVSLPLLRPDQADRFLGAMLRDKPTTPEQPESVDPAVVERIAADIRRQESSLDDLPAAAGAAQSRVQEASPDTGLTAEAKAAVRQEIRRRLRPDDPEVQRIVTTVAGRLARNPREIKRFVNVFRFYAVIRYERLAAGLPAPDTLAEVAKLAVLAVRWPHLRGALGRPYGPDTVLALLEAEIAAQPAGASWPDQQTAVAAALTAARVPERLRTVLTGSEDLFRLLATAPPIGPAAASFL